MIGSGDPVAESAQNFREGQPILGWLFILVETLLYHLLISAQQSLITLKLTSPTTPYISTH